MTRRQQYVRAWRALWPLTAFCLLFPLRYTFLKALPLLGVLGLWGGALCLFWGRKWVRAVCLGLVLTVGAVFVLPGRPPDAGAMRREYVRCLRFYRGTLYMWGGGNRLGIDCSGLVQRALIDAAVEQGVATGNPQLIRRGFALWWNDSSARELGEGYRGRTHPLAQVHSLNAADYAQLLPGDFAVTEGGGHTLAYLGDQTWIEADPSALVGDKVITVHVPDKKNAWFDMPMRLMRWREFET